MDNITLTYMLIYNDVNQNLELFESITLFIY